jgi:hypothetical protein
MHFLISALMHFLISSWVSYSDESIVPSMDAPSTISSKQCARSISSSTLHSWNMMITPAPVTS